MEKKITIMKDLVKVISTALFAVGLSTPTIHANPHLGVTVQNASRLNDWDTYKKDQIEKIRKNDESIAQLKMERAKAGKSMDAAYTQRIDQLQKKNADLRTRLNNYKYNESKWEQFKREFNHDMDELGNAIKDLGKDNVK